MFLLDTDTISIMQFGHGVLKQRASPPRFQPRAGADDRRLVGLIPGGQRHFPRSGERGRGLCTDPSEYVLGLI